MARIKQKDTVQMNKSDILLIIKSCKVSMLFFGEMAELKDSEDKHENAENLRFIIILRLSIILTNNIYKSHYKPFCMPFQWHPPLTCHYLHFG